MALFERKAKAPAKKSADKAEKATKVAAPKAEKKVVVAKVATKTSALNAPLVLNSPHVSEKAASLASTGTYVFDVPLSAGKIEVRKAVEAIYGVNVTRVNMIRGKGKVVRRGRIEGVRSDWKKALVTLKTGQKIDLYEAV